MYSKSKKANVPVVRKPSPVTLALQLVSGERLVADFRPEATLWEILEHWEKEGKLVPSLGTLANEVPICIYSQKKIMKEDALKKTSLADLDILNGKAAIRYSTKPDGETMQAHVGGILTSIKQSLPETEVASDSTLTSQTVTSESHEQELHVQDELSNHQADVEMVEMEASPATPQEPTAAVEIEEAPMEAQMEVQKEQPENSSTSIPNIMKMQEGETAVNDYHDDGRTLNFLNESGFLVYVRPRDTMELSEDLPDDFFELTEQDIKGRMKELEEKRSHLEEARLLTSALRAQQEKERQEKLLQRYPFTMLRVQFSNEFILQMPLASDSTIGKAKRELLNFITGAVAEKDFEIFTAPPKNVLDTATPVHILGLTPSSLVYISSHCAIKQEYCSSPSSFTAAALDAYSRISVNDTSLEEKPTEHRLSKRTTDSAPASSNKPAPKWLKLSKKY